MAFGDAGAPSYGGAAVSGPATPQFFQTYDPGGFMAPIAYPPGGARQYVFPAQSIGGFQLNMVSVLVIVGILLLMEHFRPK